jgi:hypothetical protein
MVGLEEGLGEARPWAQALPAAEGEQREVCGRVELAGQARARQAEPGWQSRRRLKAPGLYKWILLKWKFPPIPEMEPSSMARSGRGCSSLGHGYGQKPNCPSFSDLSTPSHATLPPPGPPHHPPRSPAPVLQIPWDLRNPYTFKTLLTSP